MVVGYETKDAPLYPPEGLFVDGTGVYDRIDGQPRFSILSNRSSSLLNGRIYPLATNHNAAGDHLKLRARHLAASGFAALVNALLNDPEVRAKYQIWRFYYASGTPVLLNALELRDSLNETLHAVDPKDHDAATKQIVVLGHSMGGVISHTLVSSSQDRVWGSVSGFRLIV